MARVPSLYGDYLCPLKGETYLYQDTLNTRTCSTKPAKRSDTIAHLMAHLSSKHYGNIVTALNAKELLNLAEMKKRRTSWLPEKNTFARACLKNKECCDLIANLICNNLESIKKRDDMSWNPDTARLLKIDLSTDIGIQLHNIQKLFNDHAKGKANKKGRANKRRKTEDAEELPQDLVRPGASSDLLGAGTLPPASLQQKEPSADGDWFAALDDLVRQGKELTNVLNWFDKNEQSPSAQEDSMKAAELTSYMDGLSAAPELTSDMDNSEKAAAWIEDMLEGAGVP